MTVSNEGPTHKTGVEVSPSTGTATISGGCAGRASRYNGAPPNPPGARKTTMSTKPSKDLDTFDNPNPERDYLIHIDTPEFTCLCPMTGQPDFAHLTIDYIPDGWLVESKSLKLFLTSFRNHGDFHEACTVSIAKRILETTEAKWLRLGGYWYPRGGIPIDVFYQSGDCPDGLWLPDPGVQPYRGRG